MGVRGPQWALNALRSHQTPVHAHVGTGSQRLLAKAGNPEGLAQRISVTHNGLAEVCGLGKRLYCLVDFEANWKERKTDKTGGDMFIIRTPSAFEFCLVSCCCGALDRWTAGLKAAAVANRLHPRGPRSTTRLSVSYAWKM